MKWFILVNIIILVILFDQTAETQSVILTYNEDAIFQCNATSSAVFTMTDTKNVTTTISYDSTKYINSSFNVLTIKQLKKADMEKTYKCVASDLNQTFDNQVKPYLYQVDMLLMTVIEGYKAIIDCYLLVGNQNSQNLTWKWTLGDKFTPITNDSSVVSNNTQSIITINSVALAYSGSVYCTAFNDYGNYSRNITLRVKSKLAPLWPFFGILAEVILLALILFLSYYFDNKKENEKSKEQ